MDQLAIALGSLDSVGLASNQIALAHGVPSTASATAEAGSLALTLRATLEACICQKQWRAARDVLHLSRLVLQALQQLQQSRLQIPNLPPRRVELPRGTLKRAAHGTICALLQEQVGILRVCRGDMPLLSLPPGHASAAAQQLTARATRQVGVAAAAVPSLQQRLLALDSTPAISAAHAASGVFSPTFGAAFCGGPLVAPPAQPQPATVHGDTQQYSAAGRATTDAFHSTMAPISSGASPSDRALALAASAAGSRDTASVQLEPLVATVALPLQVASPGDEPCELWFALYDAATGRAVSQEWLLAVDRSGALCLPEHSQTLAPGVLVTADAKQLSRQLGLFGTSGAGDHAKAAAGGVQSVTLSFSGLLRSFVTAGRAYLGCRAYRLGRLRPRSGIVRNLLSSVHDTARRAAGVTSVKGGVASPTEGGRPRAGSEDASPSVGASRWKKMFSRGGASTPDTPPSRRGSDASVTAALLGAVSPSSSPQDIDSPGEPTGSNGWNDVVPLPPGATVLDTAYRRPLGCAVCFVPPSALPGGGRWRTRRQEAAFEGATVPGGALAAPDSDADSDSDDGGSEGGSGGGLHCASLQWWYPQKGNEAAFPGLISQLIAADVAASHCERGVSFASGGGEDSPRRPAGRVGSGGGGATIEEGGPSKVGRLYTGRARAPSDRSTSSPFAGVAGGGYGGGPAPAGPPHRLASLLQGPSADNTGTWGGAFATQRFAFRPQGACDPLAPPSLPWCDVPPVKLLAATRAAAQVTPLERAARLEPFQCSVVLHSVSRAVKLLVRVPAEGVQGGNSDSDSDGDGNTAHDTESAVGSALAGDSSLPPLAALTDWLLPWLRPHGVSASGPLSGALRGSGHWQLLRAAPLLDCTTAVALGAEGTRSRASGHWPHGRSNGKRSAKRSSLYRALEVAGAEGGGVDGGRGGHSDTVGPLLEPSLVGVTPLYEGGDLHGVAGGVIPADAQEDAPQHDVTGVAGWSVLAASVLRQETLAREYSLNVLAALEVVQAATQASDAQAAGATSEGALRRELLQLQASLRQEGGTGGGTAKHMVALAARCIGMLRKLPAGAAAAAAGHWELLAVHPATRDASARVLAGLAASADVRCLLSLAAGVLSADSVRTYGGTQSRALAQRGVVADLTQLLRLLSAPCVSADVLEAFHAEPLASAQGGRGGSRARGMSVIGRRQSVVQVGDANPAEAAMHRIAAAAAAAMLGQETDSDGDEGGAGGSSPGYVDPLWSGDPVSYVQVTLSSGVFQQGKKKAGLNMQVRLHAVRKDGSVLPCLVRGVGWGGMALPSDLGQSAARELVGPLADEDGVPVPLTCAFTDGSGVVQVAVQAEPDAAPVRRRSMSAAAAGAVGGAVGGGVAPMAAGSSARSPVIAASAMSGPRHRVAATPKVEADPPHHHVFAEHRSLFPEYRSTVFYHCNTPEWNETVTVVVPTAELFDELHLRLTYYHVSANDGRSFPVGFSFFPLSHPRSRVAVQPGTHILPVYDAVQFMSTSQRQVAKSAAPYRRASALKIAAGSPVSAPISKVPYLNSFLDTPVASSMFQRGPSAQRMTVFNPPPSRTSVRDRSLLLTKPGESVAVNVVVQSSVRPSSPPLQALLGWRAALGSPSSRQRLNSAVLALMDCTPQQTIAHFAQCMGHLCALMMHLHSEQSDADDEEEHPDRKQEQGIGFSSDPPTGGSSAEDAPPLALHRSGLHRSCMALFAFQLLQLQDAAAPPPAVGNAVLPPAQTGQKGGDLHFQAAHRSAASSLSSLLSGLRDGITPPPEACREGVADPPADGSHTHAHMQGVHSENTPALRVLAASTLEHFLSNYFTTPGLHEMLVPSISACLQHAPAADAQDPIVRSTAIMLLSALPSLVRLLVHSALLPAAAAPPAERCGSAELSAALCDIRGAVLAAMRCPVVTGVANASLPVQRLAWHAVVQTAALQGAARSLTLQQHVTPDAALRSWMGQLLQAAQPTVQLPVLASVGGCLEPPIESLGGGSQPHQGAGLPASASVRWQTVPQAYKQRGWVPGSKALAVAKLCTLQAVLSHATIAPRCDVPQSDDPSHASLWHLASTIAQQHLAADAQAERLLAAAITVRLSSTLHAACTQHAEPAPKSSPHAPPLLPRSGPHAAPLAAAAWRIFTLLPELSSAITLCAHDFQSEAEKAAGEGVEGGSHQGAADHKPPPFARMLHPGGPAYALNLDACPSGPTQAAGVAGDIVSRALLQPVTSTAGHTGDSPVIPSRRRGLLGGKSPTKHRDSTFSTRNSVPLEQSLLMLQLLLAPVAVIDLKVGSLQNAVGASGELAVEPLLAVDAHVWLLPQLLEQRFVSARWTAAQQWGSGTEAGAHDDRLADLNSFAAASSDGGTRGVSFTEDVAGGGSMSAGGGEAGSRRSWSTFTARNAGAGTPGARSRQFSMMAPPAEEKSVPPAALQQPTAASTPQQQQAPTAAPPSAATAFGAEQTLCSAYRFLVDSLVALTEIVPEAAFSRLCKALSTPDGGFVGPGAASSKAEQQSGPGGVRGSTAGAGSSALDPFVRAVLAEGGRLALLARVAAAINCVVQSPAYPAEWMEQHARSTASMLRLLRWTAFASASLYLHDTVETASPQRALVRDIACGFLLKPLVTAHVSLLTSHASFAHRHWGAAPGPLAAPLEQLGVHSVSADVMYSFAAVWGPQAVPPQAAYVPSAASGPGTTGSMQLSSAPAGGSFLPARLRLLCAPLVIPVALEMTHAKHRGVARWGKDLFLDVVKAEVQTVSAAGEASPAKSPKRLHRRSFAVLARAAQEEVHSSLPVSERWTIDAIDAIVARGGVILLPKWATHAGDSTVVPDDASGTRSRNVYQPSETNMLMRLFSSGSASHTAASLDIAPQHKGLLARPQVQKFLVECRTLFRMLSAVNSYPADPPELFEEERTEAALTLIQYLRNTHRADLFTTYVRYLTELHAKMGNHAEAAYTQLLLLDLLSAQPVSQAAGTAADASTIEILQGVLLELTDGSQDWEQALLISRILAGRFFRLGSREAYLSLQRVLNTTSGIVHDLAKESTGRSKARARTPHYAVQYIGRGFPEHLRGRTFVYRQHSNKAVAVFERGLREKWSRIVAETERSMESAGTLPTDCPRTPALLIKIPFDPLLQAVHADGVRASSVDPDAGGTVKTTTQETVDLDALPPHRDLRIAMMTVEPAPLAQQEAVEAAAVYLQEQMQDGTVELQMLADALASEEELPLSPAGAPAATQGSASLAWDPNRQRCELRALALMDSAGDIPDAVQAYAHFSASARTVQLQTSLETSVLVPATVPRVDWRDLPLPRQVPAGAQPIITPRATLVPPPPAESYAHPRALVALSRTRELKTGAFTLQALTSDALVQDMDVDGVVATIMCQDTDSGSVVRGSSIASTLGTGSPFARSRHSSGGSNPSPVSSHRVSLGRRGDVPAPLTRRGSTTKRNPRRPSMLQVPEVGETVTAAQRDSFLQAASPSLGAELEQETAADLQDALREQGSEGILPEKYALIPPQLVPSVAPPSMDFVPVPPANYGVQTLAGDGSPDPGLTQLWDDNWGALLAAVRHESIKQQSRYDSMPRPLRQGREQSRVRVFSAQRPVKTRKTSNESLDVWVRCVWLVTNSAFPNLHRRSQVTHMHQILLTPFDSAIMLLRNKSNDVRFCLSRAQHAPPKSDVNFLTGQLKGVLDAAVQGGIANYEVLLTGKYVETHPEIRQELELRYGAVMAQWQAAEAQTVNANTNADSDSTAGTSSDDTSDGESDCDYGVDGGLDDGKFGADAPALAALRHALADQMAVCGDGLVLHARKCKADMLPLHDYLCEKFAGLCDKLETLGVPVQQARDLGVSAREASQELQVLGAQAAAGTA